MYAGERIHDVYVVIRKGNLLLRQDGGWTVKRQEAAIFPKSLRSSTILRKASNK